MGRSPSEPVTEGRTCKDTFGTPFEDDAQPLVSYVIATYGRPDDFVDAVESVRDQHYEPIELVAVGDSSDAVIELFAPGGRFDADWIEFYHIPDRTSPADSKNVGFEHANGDIVVHIDDDAELTGPDATQRVVSLFREHPDVGVLSFQSRGHEDREIRIAETPDTPEIGMEPTRPYRAPNFVGVGAAIRRDVLERAGRYPDEFGYGFEEMDLSLRVHDTGYDILYTPDVSVYHKKSPEGRISDRRTKEQLVENRINIALRNLPWRYVFCTAMVWTLYAVAITRRLSSVGRIYRRIYGKRDALLSNREVISPETIERIKGRKTMLFLWLYGPNPRRILGREGNLSRLKWEA